VSSARRPIKGHVIVSAVLVVGFIASCIGMQSAFNSGDRQLTRLCAVFCAVSCVASSLSIILPAVRYFERKKLEKRQDLVSFGNGDQDFIAKYSHKDRIVLSILTASFALLIIFAYTHSGRYWFKILISGIFLFCIVTVYRYLFTTVLFTDKLIVAEVKPFKHFWESYESVVALRVQPGSLRIRFEDGRILDLPSSFGDSSRIMSILEKRVKVLPDSGDVVTRNPRS
jgi:hypothetical protein